MATPSKYPPPAGLKNWQIKWKGLDYWQPIHDLLVFYYMESFGDARKCMERLEASGEEWEHIWMYYRYIKPSVPVKAEE